MDPRFELDPQSLGVAEPSKKEGKAPKPSNRPSRKVRTRNTSGAAGTGGAVYVVKAGDNLFKILMRDYGFSNDEAETLIDAIRRENNISDIRRLRIGQRVVIPAPGRIPDTPRREGLTPLANPAISGTRGQTFRIESPDAALSELEASVQIRQTWDRILPPSAATQLPVTINSPAFSLTLDPKRYPVYAAMGGGRIVVDRNDSIPPLVKSLITEKDPSVRIVSESPGNGKRFLAAMLVSAGFYSVEENFSMVFGTDPKLTVHADFRIEKTADSLINQDVILMNTGRRPFPTALNEFLKKDGLKVYEPFAALKPAVESDAGQLFQITSNRQSDIVDALLASLSITPDRDKRLDVFAADNNGISLSVNAERYFERGGQRHVITRFSGDPIAYTLYRILETKGYRIVILDDRDDFRKITEKLLARLNIQGTYAHHELVPAPAENYSVHLSGFRLEDAANVSSDLFLTNLELDSIINDLLRANGYRITTK